VAAAPDSANSVAVAPAKPAIMVLRVLIINASSAFSRRQDVLH